MSLFIGNLTPRIRRDEIERAFLRFGCCNIQLKDGYGFVHYDLPGNAEKALRALRGKNINGQPVSLTWANKQPKSFRRNTRGFRFHESHSVRGPMRREDYGTRKNSKDQRGFKMVSKQPYGRDGEHAVNNFLEKETGDAGYVEDCRGERHLDAKETLLDQDICIEPNLGDNGRWGESASNPLDGNGVENGTGFDRYEPYHGFDRTNEDKDRLVTNSHVSHALGSLGDKSWAECIGDATSKPPKCPNNSEQQQKCFICGQMGHIRPNCPQAESYWQEKFTRFDRRRENDTDFRVRGKKEQKSLRIDPQGKSNPSGSLPSSKQHKRDRTSSGSRKPRRFIMSENTTMSKETRRSPLRRDSHTKQKHRQEVGGSKKYRWGRKAKASNSSSRHSNSTTPSLCSHSHTLSHGLSSTSRSTRSRARLVSSKSCSMSSGSRAMPTSSHSGSKSSRSRSRSPSLSLSVSLGKPLTSSPNNALKEDNNASPKGYLENNGCNKCKRLLIDEGQLMEGDNCLEIDKQISTNEMTVKEDKQTLKLENEISNDHLEPWDGNGPSHGRAENEAKSPSMAPSDTGVSAANNLSFENIVEEEGIEDTQLATVLDTQAPIEKQKPDVVASYLKNPSSISSQEMYMVLKHYGWAVPEENERHFPVEAYFGSARLWPWEIIYYRRLKKGPISVENYGRRIAQNEEFGIVDKYIRSSSGWGECDHGSF